MRNRDIVLFILFFIVVLFLSFNFPLVLSVQGEAVAVSFVSAFGDILSSNFFVVLMAFVILFASIGVIRNVLLMAGYSPVKKQSDLPIKKDAAVDQKKIFDEEDYKK